MINIMFTQVRIKANYKGLSRRLYLDAHKNLMLKIALNVYMSCCGLYSKNFHHKNKGSPDELSQQRCISIEI